MREPLPPLETFDFGCGEQRSVYHVSPSVCCCGHQDFFGIGTFTSMQIYMSRYTEMQTNPASYPHRHWNGEQYLKHTLALANTTLAADERLNGCFVKPADRTFDGEA